MKNCRANWWIYYISRNQNCSKGHLKQQDIFFNLFLKWLHILGLVHFKKTKRNHKDVTMKIYNSYITKMRKYKPVTVLYNVYMLESMCVHYDLTALEQIDWVSERHNTLAFTV
jgi:hypothetical protein